MAGPVWVSTTPHSVLSGISTTVTASLKGLSATSTSGLISYLEGIDSNITFPIVSGGTIPVVVTSAALLSTAVLSSNLYALNDDTGEYDPVVIDEITHALTTIEYEHHMVHEGDMFTCDWNVGDINAAASANLFFETPNTSAYAHFTYELVTEMESTIRLYEAASYNTSGTLVPTYNKDRNSTVVATCFVHHTPNTPASATNLIRQRKMGTGTGGNRVGGTQNSTMEFILKKATKYMLQVVNDSGGAGWAIMHCQWYEHAEA